jgi:hypothetical protein
MSAAEIAEILTWYSDTSEIGGGDEPGEPYDGTETIDGVTNIAMNAFSQCYDLSTVTLPDTLTAIGAGAFCGCSELREIIVPLSVDEIGLSQQDDGSDGGAFAGCYALARIYLPLSLKLATVEETNDYLANVFNGLGLEDMSAAEIATHLEQLREKVSTSFVLDTLQYMWKGGRCTGVAALGANLLHLKPALEMKDGKLGVYKKYRGAMRSVYRQYIAERVKDRKIRPGHIFLTESGEVEPEIVEELIGLIRELSGCREVHHTMAGCTVATHCGPKTLGVLFIEE